jgi:hypothetical protein
VGHPAREIGIDADGRTEAPNGLHDLAWIVFAEDGDLDSAFLRDAIEAAERGRRSFGDNHFRSQAVRKVKEFLLRGGVVGEALDAVGAHPDAERGEPLLDEFNVLRRGVDIEFVGVLGADLLLAIAANAGETKGIGERNRFGKGKALEDVSEDSDLPSHQLVNGDPDGVGGGANRIHSSPRRLDRRRTYKLRREQSDCTNYGRTTNQLDHLSTSLSAFVPIAA